MEKVHVQLLVNCARCQQNHEHLVFELLLNPPDELTTHFCFCPVNGQPILLCVTGNETAQDNANVMALHELDQWLCNEHEAPSRVQVMFKIKELITKYK